MQDNNSSHNAPWSDQQQQHNQQQQSNGDSGSNRNDDHQQQQYDAGDEPPLEYGIFVSDIARGVTDEELKDAFSSAGQVTEALVVKNKFTGETKGFGFVKFATLDAVHAALDMSELPAFRDAVSNRVQTVKVVRADPKNVLYVGNIPRGLSEDDVRLALQEATTTYEVTKFKLCTTLEGESKGYGWVTFKDHKCAVQGMRLLQTTPVFGLYLTIHMAEPRTQEEDMLARVKSLFVRGVTPTTNAEAMKAFFGEGCEKVVIPVDVTTRAVLGHAFVHFSSRQQAELALQRCQNGTLEGESQPLTMEWCLPKEFIRGKGRGTPLRGGPDMEMGGYEGSWGGPPPPPGGNYGGGWDDPSYYDDGSGRWGGGAYRGGGFRGRGAPHRGGVPHRGRGGVYRGGYGGPPLPPPPLPPHYGAAGPYGMPHHHHHYPPPPPPVPHYYPPAYGHYQPPAYGYGHPPASAHGYPHPAAAMQTSTGASSADPYAGYYDHSAAGSGYAYPPVPPPPDYTQGYYGSPAGGKALVPRDNPRYNPY